MVAYVGLLMEWNAKINLISRKDTDQAWIAHILHCLTIVFMVDIPQAARVLDLGSGGGLPGIPIKIVRPDLRVTCLDATRKKMEAVTLMIAQLDLTEISAVWGRAEDVANIPVHRHHYDVVAARAVASLNDLVDWSVPVLATNTKKTRDEKPTTQLRRSRLIALKGGDLDTEVADVERRHRSAQISVRQVAFPSSELIPGVDKKIVIIDL